MTLVATVLYEDSKVGRDYPLHALIMRMVEDDIDGQTWRLRKLVADNPRNGIDKILEDVRSTSLIAGAGRLFVLADRDHVVEHLNRTAPSGAAPLPLTATDAAIEAAMQARSDAPGKLRVFLLSPNVEGLLAAIEACSGGEAHPQLARARQKERFARDAVFTSVARSALLSVRACIRARQTGLDALIGALGSLIPPAEIA